MNHLIPIILFAAAVAALLPLAIAAGKIAGRRLAANSLVVPDGQVTLKPSAAMALPFLIGKRGAGAGQVAIAAAGDKPLCIVEDEASADDVARGEGVNCALLGATKGTKRVQAAGAVPIDVDVYSIGGGLVDVLANAATGDWRVGRAYSATSGAGELVIVPELPTHQKPA